ncbi:MAG: thiamine pyrophosphate-binding protein [Geminicoccaceae bacterium]|nr:thiamine pyrophosphate-binding protein [Geminicoccaceae bacterium]MCS7266510.1 thiamine pyrophosphate-binding protein [Geminicoccaceae bacterium]MCX7630185.1 thiamine pyrophosphate-binding protein [Geminicoccaceae bacterium]MDW8123894.1 thiamine pyrophosphate-binding protein [Geminicoccaceae bacterium]MDW8340043.1 thiamine pyrophosphate-binding protein [Geminicoccaceae bacterium]
MASSERHGGRILVDQLEAQGIDYCFGVPGESYLPVLDGFYGRNRPRFVVCRHEGGAAMMAEAMGKLTGRPGVAFVTRGPGATNAASGVHVAQQDSTPLILFVGQIDSATRERDAFQEVDYRRMFSGMAKWVAEIDRAARIPEMVQQAVATALAGRPGPVVLALPEDMLHEKVTVDDAPRRDPVPIWPDPERLEELRERLARAQRPLAIVGGGGWTAEACGHLARFLERFDLPVAAGFRRQDIVDNEHPCYVGDLGIGPNPELVARVRAADLLLVLGSRLSEMTTQGYTLLGVPHPGVPLVHVHPDPRELGRVYAPDLAICATMPAMAAALSALPPPASRPWAEDRARLRASYLAWREPPRHPGELQMGEVLRALRARLPREAIVTNGAGNYCAWPNRFWPYGPFRSQLAPTSGSMGYGLPAAIAAKLLYPERPVVCFAGDGCFLMTGQELATAVQYGIRGLVVLVVNNGMYGTIRMHQEREYPGRVSGTELVNPDFAAYARAFGCFGARVRRSEEFAPALDEALAFPGPALVELSIDPEAITPRTTLSAIRAAASARGD